MRTKLKLGFIGIRAKTCNNSHSPSKTGHFVEGANNRSSKASKVIYTLKRRKLLFETIYTWVLNVLPWLAFQCQHTHPMVTTFKTKKYDPHSRIASSNGDGTTVRLKTNHQGKKSVDSVSDKKVWNTILLTDCIPFWMMARIRSRYCISSCSIFSIVVTTIATLRRLGFY